LQEIVGEQGKNLSVTSCFGFHEEVKVESDPQLITLMQEGDQWRDRQNV